MAKPLDEETRNKLRFFISERHLLDASGKTILESIWKEHGIKVSIVTALKLRDDAKAQIQGAVSGKAAEVQSEVLEQVKLIKPAEYIEILDRTIRDLSAVLYDPLYQGDIPAPKSLSERLQLQNAMVALIDKIIAIVGVPKLTTTDQDEMKKKFGQKKDLFEKMAELESVYKNEYLVSQIPDDVKAELACEGGI